LILAVWTFHRARASFGAISPIHVFAGPLVASGALAGVLLAFHAELFIPGLLLGAITYPVVFLAFERFVFPGDFAFLRAAITRG
jgi:hypothetical protein